MGQIETSKPSERCQLIRHVFLEHGDNRFYCAFNVLKTTKKLWCTKSRVAGSSTMDEVQPPQNRELCNGHYVEQGLFDKIHCQGKIHNLGVTCVIFTVFQQLLDIFVGVTFV